MPKLTLKHDSVMDGAKVWDGRYHLHLQVCWLGGRYAGPLWQAQAEELGAACCAGQQQRAACAACSTDLELLLCGTFSSGVALQVPHCCQRLSLQGITTATHLVCTALQAALWHTWMLPRQTAPTQPPLEGRTTYDFQTGASRPVQFVDTCCSCA